MKKNLLNGCFWKIFQMFEVNQSVIYRGMSGIITFVDNNYVIMETPPIEGRNSPRLIIYPYNYSKVQTEK